MWALLRHDFLIAFFQMVFADSEGSMILTFSFNSPAFSETRISGEILFVSGKNGRVLRSTWTPDKAETYCSPVIYRCKNGTEVVVFGSGGETHAGHLYAIQLASLFKGLINEATKLASHKKTGKKEIFKSKLWL